MKKTLILLAISMFSIRLMAQSGKEVPPPPPPPVPPIEKSELPPPPPPPPPPRPANRVLPTPPQPPVPVVEKIEFTPPVIVKDSPVLHVVPKTSKSKILKKKEKNKL